MMDLPDLDKLVSSIAVIAGGCWALWRFVLQREAHSRVEFDLDLEVLGVQSGKLIVEIVATVANKGAVRHVLRDFRFDLLCLRAADPAIEGDDSINRQVRFEPVFKRRYWIPPDWEGSFIDPGVSQAYRHVALAPGDARFLLVFAKFRYPDAASDFHTAQKVIAVDHARLAGAAK